jgi:hypothetical protein
MSRRSGPETAASQLRGCGTAKAGDGLHAARRDRRFQAHLAADQPVDVGTSQPPQRPWRPGAPLPYPVPRRAGQPVQRVELEPTTVRVERVGAPRIWPTRSCGTLASRSHDHQADTQVALITESTAFLPKRGGRQHPVGLAQPCVTGTCVSSLGRRWSRLVLRRATAERVSDVDNAVAWLTGLANKPR